MKFIALPIAARRTPRSLEVKAPSLNAGWPNRFVVAIPTPMPVSSSASLKRATILSFSACGDAPAGSGRRRAAMTPHAPSSASLCTESTGSIHVARRPAERVAAGVADGPQAEGEPVLGARAPPGRSDPGWRSSGVSCWLPAKPGRAPGSAPAAHGTGRSTLKQARPRSACARTPRPPRARRPRARRPRRRAAPRRRPRPPRPRAARAGSRARTRRSAATARCARRRRTRGRARRRRRGRTSRAGRRPRPRARARDQRAAVVADLQAGERAARVRVGVRGALAGQVRQERQALGARAPSARPRPSARGTSPPTMPRSHGQRAGGGQHHAHLVPGAGNGVAEGVDARLRVGAVLGQRGEDDAGGAHGDRQRPGPVDADAEPARGLVARAGRDGDAGRSCGPRPRATRAPSAATPRSISQRVAAPRRSSAAARRRAAACPRRRRRRSPARRSAAAARSPWAASRARCARSSRARACAATASFGAVKPVSARLPVSSTSRSKPTRSSISAHSAPVRWSFQRIAGRIGRSEASSVTSPCIWPESPIPATPSVSPSSACSVASHQSSGFCSDQPGLGCRERVRDLAALEHLAVLGDRDDFHRGGADVDPDGHA